MTDGVQSATVRSSAIDGPGYRLDAKYYQEEFVLALSRVWGCGYPVRRLRELASAFVPKRTKLITVPHPNSGAPYLKAHDAFCIRPETKRFMVADRVADYDDFVLKDGMILTPSSGRNLGPIAFVDPHLAQFAMTDIMRIVPHDDDSRFYLLAYLLTPTGQALIRRGRTGTSIDHLSTPDVHDIPVAWIDQDERSAVSTKMRHATDLLYSARCDLDHAESELHLRAGLPIPVEQGQYYSSDGAKTFGLSAADLTLRIDAAFYDATVRQARETVIAQGGVRLSACADLWILGRYKRYYVGAPHGRPILSGRQLLQMRPVNLQRISDRSFKRPEDYVVHKGWSLFTCDGRSEEALGSPAYVSSIWADWMASNHVMRAAPKAHINPGFLYAVLRSPYVQLQLKACATGSVVDALEPRTIANVHVPLLSDADQNELGDLVQDAWERIAESERLSSRTVEALEELIVAKYEGRDAQQPSLSEVGG